ncbi:RNA polymerase sigma factor [Ruminococcus sp.]|uniref:RNA polymerase sigma factor n=1 Tax=Ruminococcus sp. TaxID=41978 RepID=UPI001B1F52EA|nr:RNA polymerase sigma factor [Ruminococcus sp.]MBO5559713.1 RNA polymerase sigma factor [Ruminococcus sp.]
MDRQETAALVKQVQDGDRAAFERLYEQYRDRLFFFVLKNVGSREDAEDIVSESFVKALENISELRSGEAFGGWLYRIAYALCMDWLKVEGQNAHFDSDTELDSVIESSALNEPVMVPDNYVESEQVRAQLKAMIDSLKPDMRSAVILYYYEEQTVAQVAKTLGMNENAAKQKLFQARKKLKQKIEKLFKNSAAFCAVPLGAVLESVVEPGTVKGATGAVVGSGFVVKAVAVTAAAVIAVGVPVGLHRMGNKMGDARVDNSIVQTEKTEAYELLPDPEAKAEVVDIIEAMSMEQSSAEARWGGAGFVSTSYSESSQSGRTLAAFLLGTDEAVYSSEFGRVISGDENVRECVTIDIPSYRDTGARVTFTAVPEGGGLWTVTAVTDCQGIKKYWRVKGVPYSEKMLFDTSGKPVLSEAERYSQVFTKTALDELLDDTVRYEPESGPVDLDISAEKNGSGGVDIRVYLSPRESFVTDRAGYSAQLTDGQGAGCTYTLLIDGKAETDDEQYSHHEDFVQGQIVEHILTVSPLPDKGQLNLLFHMEKDGIDYEIVIACKIDQ